MFALNFKKDWRMNKSLFISFFAILFLLLFVNTAFFIVLKNINPGTTYDVLRTIWGFLATLSSLIGTILTIVLMYFVLKNDLGKNKIQYSIFTPQSILSWYLPKVLFVLIVQGLFALIDLGYTYFVFDLIKSVGQTVNFNFWDNMTLFLTKTFNFGFFALLTLCIALYYSFRKKGLSWFLIVVAVLIYFIGDISYTIYQQIQSSLHDTTFKNIPTMVIPYVIKNVIGLVYLFISIYLFDKKIEY